METADIDTWNFEKVIAWFDEKDEDYSEFETLEEMKTFVKQKSSQTESPVTISAPDIGQTVLRDILEREIKMKEKINGFYSDIQQLTTECDSGVQCVLREGFGDYIEQIRRNMDELGQKECPILIVGETSSGKSSLVNLLVGESLLPTSLLAESSAICCLHNSEKMYFTVEYKEGNIETEECETACDFSKKLAEKISRRNLNVTGNNGPEKIDVFFNMPFLTGHTTIVDSPGVGESDELTQQILKFLPKSVAFIYVLDSSNAGGIQQDRLGYILGEQKELESVGELVSFDFRNAIIICNKWDIVEDKKEEVNTWEHTIKKLKELMPNLNEDLVFKMSIMKELRHQHLKLQPTEQYQQFVRGLSGFLPTAVLKKLNRHYRWQGKFLESIQFCLNSRIKFAFATKEEKQKLEKDVKSKLEDLKEKSSQIIDDLDKISAERCDSVVDDLHRYLNTPDLLESLRNWEDDHQLTKLHIADQEVLDRELKRMINLKLHLIMNKWATQEPALASAYNELEKLLTERLSSIDAKCKAVDKCFDEERDDYDTCRSTSEQDSIDTSTNSKQGIQERIRSTLTIDNALIIYSIGVKLGMDVMKIFKRKVSSKEANLKRHLAEICQVIIDNAKKRENIKMLVNDTYFGQFKRKINEWLENNIAKEISAKEALLSMIMNEADITEDQIKELKECMEKTERILRIIKAQRGI